MLRAAFFLFLGLMCLSVLLPAQSFAVGNGGLFAEGIQASLWPQAPNENGDRLAVTKIKWKQCQPGQQHDPITGVCFSCSHNDHFENGKCVPCVAGFHEEGDQCVADAKKGLKTNGCPQGMEMKNGKCKKSTFPPIEQCADGQELDPASGTCFSCSHNDHFENGKCVPCPPGFHEDGDACVTD